MVKNNKSPKPEIPPRRRNLLRVGGLKYWFILAFIFRLVLSFGNYHPDLGNHLDWGMKFWELGAKNFYENQFWAVSWANQPPGTIYLFGLVGAIYRGIMSLFWWLNLNVGLFPSNLILWAEVHLYPALVKLPFILADLGMAYFAGKIAIKLFNNKVGKLVALVALFNPIFWYISAIWGQTDSLINFLCLFSVYLFVSQRPLSGIVIFLVSLYFKVSLIILLPVMLLWLVKSKGYWIEKISVIVGLLLALVLTSTPFVRGMDPFSWLFHLYIDKVIGHQGNMLTANAFNLWALLYGIDFTRTDLIRVIIFNLKQWGMLLFGLSYIGSLIYLVKNKFTNINFLISLIIIALTSFLFMTNMHERYLFPAVSLLTIICFMNRRLTIIYLFICIVWLLNLYHLWYYPRLDWLINLYNPLTVKILSMLNLIIYFYLVIVIIKLDKLVQLDKRSPEPVEGLAQSNKKRDNDIAI